MPGTFFHLQPEMYQKMMSQKGQRHMMMPAAPGSGLVMIHPQFALGFLNRRFDRPAQSCLAHQIGLCDLRWRIAQIIFDLGRITRATTKDHPDFVPRTAATLTYCAHKRKVGADRPFRSFFDRVAFPDPGRSLRRHLTDFLRCRLISRHAWTTARAPRLEVPGLVFTNSQNLHLFRPDHRVDRYFGEVPFLQLRHAIEKIRIHAVMLVSINPAKWRDPGLFQGVDHFQSRSRLGLEDQLLRQTAFSPFGRVRLVKPRFGNVEPAVKKSVTATRRINQEDSLLAIGEFAQRSAILLLHADRVFPFLREAATVNDHRPVWLPEVCGDQSLISLQHSIVVPSAFANELLDGSHGVDVFSALTQDHRLDALAFQIRQLSMHIQLPPFALFAARKQWRIFGVIVTQLQRQSLCVTASQISAWRLPARWRKVGGFRLNLFCFAHFVLPVGFATGRISKNYFSL